MANPSVFWYPNDGGAIKELRTGYSLQILHPVETYIRPTSTNGIGAPYMVGLMGEVRVTLRKERMRRDTDSDMINDFFALENHLRRGGTMGVALDRTKAFAAYVTTGLTAGGTAIEGGPNIYKDILTAQSITLALASGDRFWLESGNPDFRRERLTCDGAPTVTALLHAITASRAIVMDRDADSGVMVRHEDFYPAVYLPEDQLDREIITTESGALYTFEAELVIDGGIYSAGNDQDLPALILAPAVSSAASPSDPHILSDTIAPGFALLQANRRNLSVVPVGAHTKTTNGFGR